MDTKFAKKCPILDEHAVWNYMAPHTLCTQSLNKSSDTWASFKCENENITNSESPLANVSVSMSNKFRKWETLPLFYVNFLSTHAFKHGKICPLCLLSQDKKILSNSLTHIIMFTHTLLNYLESRSF